VWQSSLSVGGISGLLRGAPKDEVSFSRHAAHRRSIQVDSATDARNDKLFYFSVTL
jgi:hypothetical protein